MLNLLVQLKFYNKLKKQIIAPVAEAPPVEAPAEETTTGEEVPE